MATMDKLLTTANVAELLGVKPATIRLYRTSSRPGGRYEQHPFPEPDDHVGINPVWVAGRKEELLKWAATRPGQGKGGGQPAQKRNTARQAERPAIDGRAQGATS